MFCRYSMLVNFTFLKFSSVIYGVIVFISQLQCVDQRAAVSILDTAIGLGSITQNIFPIDA